MKKIYCDLCGKEIKSEDIQTEIPLNIGGKQSEINLHSICYYKFMQVLRKEIIDDEKNEKN